MQKEELKKKWVITPSAFHQLLNWLDEGVNSDGQSYLETRRRLVIFFDRKNCPAPDELADETLNRVARRLEEEGKIESDAPAKYCYVTARFVFMEYLRAKDKTSVPLDSVLQLPQVNKLAVTEAETEERNLKEKRLNCLEQCVGKLETGNREIILSYYFGAEKIKIENRRALSEKLGISANALSIRACRIRDKLETCVRKCVAET